MVNASNRQLAMYAAAAIATIFAAFITAITITTFSPFLALAAGGLVIGLLASKKYTFLPIIFITLVICDVIPIPKGGRLYPALIIACCFLSIILSLLKKRGIPRISGWAWSAVAIYSFTMCWGYFYGVKYLNNNPVFALSEFQQTLALLIFPAILFSFNEKSASEKIINLIVAIGLLIGIATIFQYSTGISLGGRVEQLETLGNVDSNIIRATIPGKLFLLFSLFLVIPKIMKADAGSATFWFLLGCILMFFFALLVSFGRALWACALLGIFVSASFLGVKHFFKLTVFITLLGLVSASLLATVKPDVYDAVVDRAVSVSQEGRSSSSFGWRLTENSFAARSISKNSLLGIGLGGEYKPPLVANELFPNQTSYIHNSYYFVLLKFGYLGLLCFGTFVICVIICLFSNVNNNTSDVRIFRGAAAATILAVLLLAVTQPELISAAFIAYLSFILAAASELSRNSIETGRLKNLNYENQKSK